MRRIAAVGMVAVLGMGAVACTSSKDDAKPATTESQSLTATVPTTAATTTTTAPSQAMLDGLLLTAAEVGPDWTLSPSSGTDSGSDLPACLQGLDQLSPDRTSASAEFDKAGGDFFAEDLEFAGPDVIASEFAAATGIIDSCTDLTLDANGTPISGTIARIPLTAGDMSAAYEMTFVAQGVTLTMYLGVVGVDGYALSTAVGQIDNPDRSTFDQLTNDAVAKIVAGGSTTA